MTKGLYYTRSSKTFYYSKSGNNQTEKSIPTTAHKNTLIKFWYELKQAKVNQIIG